MRKDMLCRNLISMTQLAFLFLLAGRQKCDAPHQPRVAEKNKQTAAVVAMDVSFDPLLYAAHAAFTRDPTVLCTVVPPNLSRFATSPRRRVLPPPGPNHCIDALIVVLNHARTGGQGGRYASMLELQLGSIELCAACRSVPMLRVRVGEGCPRSLRDHHPRATAAASSRVPALRARHLIWALPTWTLPEDPSAELWKNSECLQLQGPSPAGSLESAAWPDGLENLILDTRLQMSVETVVWPPSLRRLSFGDEFDQPLAGVVPHLVWLSCHDDFGRDGFCRPTAGVVWPESVRHLSFGEIFNQPLGGVAWPPSLRRLSLGKFFNQPLNEVSWPASLERVDFGKYYNKPIAAVAWPAALRSLSFGDRFNQPLVDAVWPPLLKELSFGERFNEPIAEVAWPSSLRSLSFGDDFDQPLGWLPPSLETLSLGDSFNQAVSDVLWPGSLERLAFGKDFNQPIADVSWPDALQRMSFGQKFRQPVAGVDWPSALRHVLFGAMVYQATDRIVWPVHP